MGSMQTLFHWVAQNQFTAVSVFFGGSLLAVTLYRYVTDYRMMASQK
jgi:hypothetical protein